MKRTIEFIFYDTWAYLAMADKSDRSAHQAANTANRQILLYGNKPLTTNYVVDESLTLVKRRLGHFAASMFLRDLEAGISSELIRLEWISPEREHYARELFLRYRERPGLSFTDCTSLVVMADTGATRVFTADQDFEEVDPKRYPFRCLIRQKKGKYFAQTRDVRG